MMFGADIRHLLLVFTVQYENYLRIIQIDIFLHMYPPCRPASLIQLGGCGLGLLLSLVSTFDHPVQLIDDVFGCCPLVKTNGTVWWAFDYRTDHARCALWQLFRCNYMLWGAVLLHVDDFLQKRDSHDTFIFKISFLGDELKGESSNSY